MFSKKPSVLADTKSSSALVTMQGSKLTVVWWPKSTKNAVGPPKLDHHSCAVVRCATGNF